MATFSGLPIGSQGWAPSPLLHHAQAAQTAPDLTGRSASHHSSIALGNLWMGLGIALRGSWWLWEGSMALGTAREG